MISRRSFMALASGLFVPYEPERIYSFLPAWRLVSRSVFDNYLHRGLVVRATEMIGDGDRGRFATESVGHWVNGDPFKKVFASPGEFWINPANLLDVQKSCEAYGERRVFA